DAPPVPEPLAEVQQPADQPARSHPSVKRVRKVEDVQSGSLGGRELIRQLLGRQPDLLCTPLCFLCHNLLKNRFRLEFDPRLLMCLDAFFLEESCEALFVAIVKSAGREGIVRPGALEVPNLFPRLPGLQPPLFFPPSSFSFLIFARICSASSLIPDFSCDLMRISSRIAVRAFLASSSRSERRVAGC